MNIEKRAIRQRLREQRRGLSPCVVEAAGRAVWIQLRELPPFEAAVSLIAYLAHENEVPTVEVLEEAARTGRSIYVPQTGGGVVRWYVGATLTVGRTGIGEPLHGIPEHPTTPAVALVPVVAWDARGGRLGRGGGFYDRLFTKLVNGVTRIGLAYEFQECPEIPRAPWDVCLDYVITERRVVRCGGAVDEASPEKGGLQWS